MLQTNFTGISGRKKGFTNSLLPSETCNPGKLISRPNIPPMKATCHIKLDPTTFPLVWTNHINIASSTNVNWLIHYPRPIRLPHDHGETSNNTTSVLYMVTYIPCSHDLSIEIPWLKYRSIDTNELWQTLSKESNIDVARQ